MKIQTYARLQRIRTRFLRSGHYVGVHRFRRHGLRLMPQINPDYRVLKCDWCGYRKRAPG